MRPGSPGAFGAQLKALRDAAGYTQEELATIAGLSVHAVSALERGERRRAILAVRRGNADAAIALVRESLTRIRELHDKFAFVYVLVPLAAAAVLKGDDAWAARILGARDAVTDRTGVTVVDTSVTDLRERAEREVRARVGPARWARSYAAGRSMSIDALLDDIDSAAGR
jgi:ATP/maltotriose-dependent transcriptional regulator MalT